MLRALRRSHSRTSWHEVTLASDWIGVVVSSHYVPVHPVSNAGEEVEEGGQDGQSV